MTAEQQQQTEQQQSFQSPQPEDDDDPQDELVLAAAGPPSIATDSIGWRSRLMPGTLLDAQDSTGRWCEAVVQHINRSRGPATVSVQATPAYASRADRGALGAVPHQSTRLAPLGAYTYRAGSVPRVGQRLEIQDPEQLSVWHEAVINDLHQNSCQVRYCNPHPCELWMQLDSRRLRPCRPPHRALVSSSNANAKAKAAASAASAKRGRQASLQSADPASDSLHKRAIAIASERCAHYEHSLHKQGLSVHHVEGDGNCLFRSVSHQVYGDDRHHALVRAKCMDYMDSEREYFEPYVEGSMQDFLTYLDRKRQVSLLLLLLCYDKRHYWQRDIVIIFMYM
jgi:OTU-like cysteine protease